VQLAPGAIPLLPGQRDDRRAQKKAKPLPAKQAEAFLEAIGTAWGAACTRSKLADPPRTAGSWARRLHITNRRIRRGAEAAGGRPAAGLAKDCANLF